MSIARLLASITFLGLLASMLTILYFGLFRNGRWYKKTLILLLVLLLGNALSLYPLPLPTINIAAKAGSLPVFQNRSGFPVVLALGDIREGKDFFSTDWSYAWANLLEQEVCGCHIVPIDSIDEHILDEALLLVLSKTASTKVPQETVKSLKTWVEAGGVALVEFPTSSLFDLTGVKLEEVGKDVWFPKSVTWVSCNGEFLSESLLDLPLGTSCLSIVEVSENCSVIMEMDHRPAVVLRTIGNGAVLTFLFDVGQELTALQQGVPDDGFRMSDKRGSSGIVDATDLLMNSNLLDCSIPYADVLERWIISQAEGFVVFPRIWYFQYPYDGVVTMTHDEDWFGDESCFVFVEESARDYNSTFFVISRGPITSDGLNTIQDLGGDIQIHWNRETERWLTIFKKGDGSLKKQIEVLETKIGKDESVSLCRIHRLRWENHYTQAFRIMEAQGIRLDSSLGSAGKTGRGYMHSTSLPYHPIDTNGKPFSLYELPLEIQAKYSGIDALYIEQLLRDSKDCYHEVINALYHPSDLIEGKPSREDWLLFHELARQENHNLITMSEMLDWWCERGTTEIGNATWKNYTLTFTLKSHAEGLAAFIPVKSGQVVVQSILVDGRPENQTRQVLVQGKEYLLVAVDLGSHRLTVNFGHEGS